MEIDQTIQSYLKYLRAAGYAESTVGSYGRNLALFRKYLAKLGLCTISQVTGRQVETYHRQVMNEMVAPETAALKIRTVKRLFEYLTDVNKLLVNPAERLVCPRRKKQTIGTVLTLDEVNRLLEETDISSKVHLRNRAVMEVMYSSALRVSEIEHLCIHDVDLNDREIRVWKSKGNKDRVVPLGNRAARYLMRYARDVRPVFVKLNPGETRLFLNNVGKPLKAGSVRTFLRRYRISAGIDKCVSPHTLRRTCATHMLCQGADIRHIQKLLGHEKLSTTQAYTKLSPAEIKEMHKMTHPGACGEKAGYYED